jgi:outer membrane protein assembly factor BamB
LWSRDLGEGYSAIVVESGRLYTMQRKGDEEVVVCLDAATGETIWETPYAASPAEGHVHQFGAGPRATPLVAGDSVYTIGVSGRLNALEKQTGKIVWSQDLWGSELGGNKLDHGYSSSPIDYKDTIIALVGGKDASIVAFDKKSGKAAWKATGFENSYSTPRVLDVDGEQQLVTFMAEHLVGVDPDDGKVLWQYPHTNTWKQNISMPVMADANTLLLSSPEAGAKGLRLTHEEGKTKVEEIWSTRKIQFYHVTTVRDGDWVYGSTGTREPTFMAAINIKTGEIAWRERGFAKANCVMADGRLIILDEDGNLALAQASPKGLSVLSRTQLFDEVAWTVPTVVGRTLYVRDKSKILALDLG